VAHIDAALRHLAVPVGVLRTNPANLRDHDDRSLDTIAAGLRRFGQRLPLIVRPDGVILAGNGRWLAATTRLGWSHVAAVTVMDDDAAAEAFAMFDNRVGEVGTSWRFDALAAVLQAAAARGDDLGALGWDAAEAAPLLAADFTPAPVDDDATFGAAHKLHHVVVTEEQLAVFTRAAERVRAEAGDPDMPAGRCLELLSADYLAG
jgi:hypothetical protein